MGGSNYGENYGYFFISNELVTYKKFNFFLNPSRPPKQTAWAYLGGPLELIFQRASYVYGYLIECNKLFFPKISRVHQYMGLNINRLCCNESRNRRSSSTEPSSASESQTSIHMHNHKKKNELQ